MCNSDARLISNGQEDSGGGRTGRRGIGSRDGDGIGLEGGSCCAAAGQAKKPNGAEEEGEEMHCSRSARLASPEAAEEDSKAREFEWEDDRRGERSHICGAEVSGVAEGIIGGGVRNSHCCGGGASGGEGRIGAEGATCIFREA